MKKTLSLLLTLVCILSLALPALAEGDLLTAPSPLILSPREDIDSDGDGDSAEEEPADGAIPVYLDLEEIAFDVPAQIIGDRTMVPLRAIFEALGAEVEWDDGTKTVTSTRDGMIVSITIGKNEIVKNGTATPIDVPAQIVDSRTLVPVRAIAESFDCRVMWDDRERAVYILSFPALPEPKLTSGDKKITHTYGNQNVTEAIENLFSSPENTGVVFQDGVDPVRAFCAARDFADARNITLRPTAQCAFDMLFHGLMSLGDLAYAAGLAASNATDASFRWFMETTLLMAQIEVEPVDFAPTDNEVIAYFRENVIGVKTVVTLTKQDADNARAMIDLGASMEDVIAEFSLLGDELLIAGIYDTFGDTELSLSQEELEANGDMPAVGEVTEVMPNGTGLYAFFKRYAVPEDEYPDERLLSDEMRQDIVYDMWHHVFDVETDKLIESYKNAE